MLSSGIPTRDDYKRLESTPFYAELLDFSRGFEEKCQVGSPSIRNYNSKWVKDPFLQWSRRWEYVYVAQRILPWAATRGKPLKLIDAGSGFTFFPYFLMQANPSLCIDCFDRDPIVGEALLEAAEILGVRPGFRIEDLEGLSLENQTVDAVYSVSVIEHTKNPRKVIDEINRVLKPGGIFVCSFDISFETHSPMHVHYVEELVAHITRVFDCPSDWQPISFESLPADKSIVTTHWDDRAVKAGLPWRNPLLVWLYDVLRGRFRTALYRPMTFCCGAFTKKLS